MAETITILSSNYPPIKNKIKKFFKRLYTFDARSMVQVTGQLQDNGAKHSVPDGALVNPALRVNHWLKILEKVMLQKA